MGYIIAIGFVAFAIWLILYLTGCPHQWKVIESYHVRRTFDKEIIGYKHVKECEFCHKLKSEHVSI